MALGRRVSDAKDSTRETEKCGAAPIPMSCLFPQSYRCKSANYHPLLFQEFFNIVQHEHVRRKYALKLLAQSGYLS